MIGTIFFGSFTLTNAQNVMKKVVILYVFLFCAFANYAQETYSINNETIELKRISNGTLDFYVTTDTSPKRFFVKKNDGEFIELKDIKKANSNDMQYISVLKDLTSDTDVSTERVKFTRASLKNFIGFYNYKKAIETEDGNRDYPVNFRFGFSGGLTNNPFQENPENTLNPLIGLELELYGDSEMPRHSGFLQGRHSFSSDKFDYAATEFSIGYRFRIINQPGFNIYVQNKFATLNFKNYQRPEMRGEEIVLVDISETEFNIPMIFGLGTDIKVCEKSYITLIFGELFALLQENKDNFPTDISIGYKFNL
ncbi:hypothetical protein [Winogradskyella sp. A3E31]|uniref:hypothetical protein n=1 Tax=Winogradskyella sp. A3E31 TaxID=3349637 RepID=UPI00398A9E66